MYLQQLEINLQVNLLLCALFSLMHHQSEVVWCPYKDVAPGFLRVQFHMFMSFIAALYINSLFRIENLDFNAINNLISSILSFICLLLFLTCFFQLRKCHVNVK